VLRVLQQQAIEKINQSYRKGVMCTESVLFFTKRFTETWITHSLHQVSQFPGLECVCLTKFHYNGLRWTTRRLDNDMRYISKEQFSRIRKGTVVVYCSPSQCTIDIQKHFHLCVAFPLPVTQQPLVGQNLPIIEASRSHTDTPHSVGLLWTSDQPDAENSAWQHTTFTRDRHTCSQWHSNKQC
jgi:hypothetical protein